MHSLVPQREIPLIGDAPDHVGIGAVPGDRVTHEPVVLVGRTEHPVGRVRIRDNQVRYHPAGVHVLHHFVQLPPVRQIQAVAVGALSVAQVRLGVGVVVELDVALVGILRVDVHANLVHPVLDRVGDRSLPVVIGERSLDPIVIGLPPHEVPSPVIPDEAVGVILVDTKVPVLPRLRRDAGERPGFAVQARVGGTGLVGPTSFDGGSEAELEEIFAVPESGHCFGRASWSGKSSRDGCRRISVGVRARPFSGQADLAGAPPGHGLSHPRRRHKSNEGQKREQVSRHFSSCKPIGIPGSPLRP